MIQMFEYTKEEVDKLYSAVENSVQNHNPIDMQLISKIIHAGDLYLFGMSSGGPVFCFNGLKWVRDGRIYCCQIQPQNRGDVLPEWIPVITFDDRTWTSSGDLSMICKENRYLSTDPGWDRI